MGTNYHWIPAMSTLGGLKLTDDLFLVPQFGRRESLLWRQGCCFLFWAIYFSTRMFESGVVASSLVILTIGSRGNEPESSACSTCFDGLHVAGWCVVMNWTPYLACC